MTRPLRDESYDPAFFALLFQVEPHHFWFVVRNRVLTLTIKQLTVGLPDGFRLLEVGCGTGFVLSALCSVCTRGTVVGMDLFSEGMCLARRRSSASLVQGDMHAPPFGARFDLVGLFDVLEHSRDDREVLQSLRSLLVVGGKLVLTVPAHPSLWSYFDEASHHVRRYERADLDRKLYDHGYEVEKTTYFMASLLPLMWLRRRLRRRTWGAARHAPPATDLAARELRVNPLVNKLLSGLLALELRWLAWRGTLPFGASLLVIARRA